MNVDPGTLIGGRYRVERALAEGGMGVVYVALDTKFDKPVALKLTAAGGGPSQGMLEARFKREAQIGNELGEESGFVRAFDWGQAPPAGLYLAMDLVRDAEELDLRTGSRQQRLRSLCAAAELVARAHDRGVIHRDLKPANFLQADGQLYLTDFGIARFRGSADDEQQADPERVTKTGVGMGTPVFMPPEQFTDAKQADERADVYALGVLLFLALTETYPYAGRSATEIMRKQIGVETGLRPAPRPRDVKADVPAQLDELCARAIALTPAERLSSAQELVDGLRRFLEDAGAGAAATPTPSPAELAPTVIEEAASGAASGSAPAGQTAAARRPPEAPPRSPVGVAAVGLSALALLAGIGFVLSQSREPPTMGAQDPTPLELNVVAEAVREDRTWVALTEGTVLRSGDGFRLRVTCDREAFLYVLSVDADENTTLLYPHSERLFPELEAGGVRCANPVAPAEEVTIPPSHPSGDPNLFWLDEVAGREALYVAASLRPIAVLEEILPGLRTGARLEAPDRERVLSLLRDLGARTGAHADPQERAHRLQGRGAVVRWLEFEHQQ